MIENNMTIICVLIMIFDAFLSAFSQILLKKSASVEHGNVVKEYLNVRVITAYIIFAFVLVANAFAYQGISYKYGAVIGASSYIFVMILSKLILKELITSRIILGNILIVVGIIVYSSNLF